MSDTTVRARGWSGRYSCESRRFPFSCELTPLVARANDVAGDERHIAFTREAADASAGERARRLAIDAKNVSPQRNAC